MLGVRLRPLAWWWVSCSCVREACWFRFGHRVFVLEIIVCYSLLGRLVW